MKDKNYKATRVDILLRFFQNNKFTSSLILLGILIIALAKVTESGDNILRKLGIVKSYDIDKATIRGKFSSDLLENINNRLFWVDSYTGRVRLRAATQEQDQAWQKYIEANEKWNSNLINYYLGLDEYYPNSGKRGTLEGIIQEDLRSIHSSLIDLRYNSGDLNYSKILTQKDSIDWSRILLKLDSINAKINDIRPKIYSFIDKSEQQNK